MDPAISTWLRETDYTLRGGAYGLAGTFSSRIALFLAYLFQYGLRPRITSAWRDPAKQRAMRAAWDRGDRQGLRARPADPDASDHCNTSWGRPASTAVDIVTSDDRQAAAIARALGIGVGADFKTPDPGHYFQRDT